MIKVTVWNEHRHEKTSELVKNLYPRGIHGAIADFLACGDISVRTATLEEDECGLTQEILDDTDVLIWWGHMAHGEVPDGVVKRVCESVLKGMGMIFLHSAHHSKPFKTLMGTTGNLSWRNDGDLERVWVCDRAHPIAQGIDRYFELEHEEVYGEPFDIPQPDRLVFMSWFEGGEVFRSGCCYFRGNGRIFYFQPGHEGYPTYHNGSVQQVIKNAVRWAKPVYRAEQLECPKSAKI